MQTEFEWLRLYMKGRACSQQHARVNAFIRKSVCVLSNRAGIPNLLSHRHLNCCTTAAAVPPKYPDANAAAAGTAAGLGPPPGLIKSDWLSKHRSRRPAAGLALVTQRELADGDPTSMLAMLQVW
eukprot:366331-Chlamydomonas_euryale.AAC.39